MNAKIKRLLSEISEENEKISNCSHDFGEPFYDPEMVSEGYGYKMVGQGSDVWGEFEGYRDVPKARWTRVCKICGKEEHTNTQYAASVDYKPYFKNND